MSFDFKTLPKVNIVPHYNDGIGVEIIEFNDTYTLFNNGIRWMIYKKDSYQEEKELYSSYDLAYGDVLISGLGFGTLALWLANKPGVRNVTVIEISKEVIELFLKNNNIPNNLTIINDNMSTYETEKKYDCLFLDHYELQHPDWALYDANKISKRIKHDIFWTWALEAMYMNKMYSEVMNNKPENNNIWLNKDYSDKWIDFLNFYYPDTKSLHKIKPNQLNSYIKTYFS